jgi:hypothetical protein
MQLSRNRTALLILFIVMMLLVIVTGASAGFVSCQEVDAMSCGPGGYSVATGEVACEPSECIAIEGCEGARGACDHAAVCDGKTCVEIIKVQQQSGCGVPSEECCPAAMECRAKL